MSKEAEEFKSKYLEGNFLLMEQGKRPHGLIRDSEVMQAFADEQTAKKLAEYKEDIIQDILNNSPLKHKYELRTIKTHKAIQIIKETDVKNQ